jgi:signal transduction histidine kinase
MLRGNSTRKLFAMLATLLYLFRTAIAWGAAILFVNLAFDVVGISHVRLFNFILVSASFIVLGAKIAHAFWHVRRVQLITGKVDADTLSNRQRRHIEIPFDTNEAFALVDAAIRELPGATVTESARDSLQIRAKVARADRTVDEAKKWPGFVALDNRILATIAPGDGSCSVTLVCEPDGGAWSDWFHFDDGSNLENAESITRAIARRVAERRRSEQASAAQTGSEKELAVAKLNLLHAQIEPHFLYNTLASAQILTRTDPARADEMLGNLISYLRNSLPKSENEPSTLGAELERARAYLDILKIRMGERLHTQIEVPEALKSAPFPAMMLQTLVENAIKHGLEPKYGGGTIWILARENTGNLTVTVADDGQGFNAQSSGTGIGLKNVRERLKLAYGTAASFVIAANFPNGVAATITLPASATTGATHA